MRASHDFRFDASSPVGRHWLIHGVGFTVRDQDGRRLGVVEDVLVDPLQHRAARVLVRRRGLFRRPRRVTIDPGAIESVLPGARQFVVEAPADAAPPPPPLLPSPPRAEVSQRVGRIGVSARDTGRELARGVRPLVAALDRRLVAGVAVTLGSSRRGASAGAVWVRREAPRLDAWLSLRAHEAGRVALTAGRALATAARGVAVLLADLVVLVAVAAVAAWRRASASAQQARRPLEEDLTEPNAVATQWHTDVDEPLARETRSEAPMRPTGRRRADARRH